MCSVAGPLPLRAVLLYAECAEVLERSAVRLRRVIEEGVKVNGCYRGVEVVLVLVVTEYRRWGPGDGGGWARSRWGGGSDVLTVVAAWSVVSVIVVALSRRTLLVG